jgi:cytochrome c-type biogenesis protein CcmE
MVNGKLKLGIALGAGLVAVLLIFRNISQAAIFTIPVEDLVVEPDEYTGKTIKLDGQVITQTISQKPGTLEYRFEVRPKILREGQRPEARPNLAKVSKDATIVVFHKGIVPDTLWLKDEKTGYGAEVTVTGFLRPDGTFESSNVIAKCPSKYEETKPGVRPQASR